MTDSTDDDLLTRRRSVLGNAPLFYEQPVHLVRGEGAYVFDADGNRYLDMYNNVPCVGHANPHVVEAVARQAATLNVHSRYLDEGAVAYAERLVAKHDPSLDQLVYACTGTEANEIAIAMARFATGGRGIICSGSAYHGNSEAVGKLTFASARRDPEIRTVRFPETYRPIEDGLTEAELCDRYLDDVRQAIDGFAADGVPLAGMLVCSLFANEGLPDIPAGYMERAADMVRAAGGLFVADEVQAGFCRAGRWWGYEVTDFVPDIATMGKPMGNGLPLAGVVARSELVDTFRKRSRYFNTFAGTPLQAAAGAAVLDVIEGDDLGMRAADVGAYLRDGLAKIDCPSMADIRGSGNFTGIDWVSDPDTRTPDVEGAVRMVNLLKDRGILTSNAGALFNVVKLRPPLVFDRADTDHFLDVFADTVAEAAR